MGTLGEWREPALHTTMAESSFLEVDQVTVGYGGVPVLRNISLSVNAGELVALLGSSGCGKTTLLRTIAGFALPTSGRIRAAGRDITRRPPDKRDMALVFQSYALWPHMNVRQNVGYGLKLRHVRPEAIAAKVDELLDILGLAGLGERKVTALSGGQRQRVALGRALAVDPRILLLDEPLSNLDARIRRSVRHEIRALQRRLGITAIHVTHDREEAMVMADRIVILNGGRIEQQGPPEEVYNAPATPFVARFMGAENAIELSATVSSDRIEIPAGEHHLAASLRRQGDGLVKIPGAHPRMLTGYFRSEAAEIVERRPRNATARDEIVLAGEVTQASYPGGIWRHTVQIGDRDFYVDAPVRHSPGSKVSIRLPAQSVFLFPGSTGFASDKDLAAEATEGARSRAENRLAPAR
jgi:ABC-type Fe3+/spermidine/putrescine transport system ATPase subunit